MKSITMNKLLAQIPLLMMLIVFSGCQQSTSVKTDFINYVDPFIGTDFHGHTFPGATTPFGMVQLSPDTRTQGWDACAGYHYSDSTIIGFSHTHLSGTGIGDYGDILFMPFTGEPALEPGTPEDPDSGYRSRFNRETESASPGYYYVELEDYGIGVELSATPRAGMHKYQFPASKEAGIIIDLRHTIHGHANPLHEIKIINNQEIQGLKITRGWARYHYVYFTAKFSKPFEIELYLDGKLQTNTSEISGENALAKLIFPTEKDEIILAKVGISPVGYEGSARNLEKEIPTWDFSLIRKEAEKSWMDKLSKFEVESDNHSEKKKFYTAIYHSYIAPNLYGDVDGSYRGMDQEIYQSESPNYTVFSLWDTYRALHPFFTIAEPSLNQELIRALIRKYEEGGILPMWELASNYTGTMIGSHAVSVIVDSYMKGQRDFDSEKALEACLHAVKYDSINKNPYISEGAWNDLMPKAKLYEEEFGFIPCDLEHSSVSKALEYAYNYWGIAKMAEDMGKERIAREFFEKSKRYKSYFDNETDFMRGKKLDGSWIEPFHPRHSAHTGSPYVEGNAWQWTWYVPHDVEGLIELMGGKEAFARKLDSLFTITSEVLGEEKSGDITGLIGQYAHGNEPSHHIIYLFNYIDMPWRTQELTREILSNFYTDQPDGLCGNEDCGQMSAWYVLNAMGFYPVCPGNAKYSIGIPVFDKLTIHPREGITFIVTAENLDKQNPYVQEVFLNDSKLSTPFISHFEIENGGSLHFVMGHEKKVFWK